MHHGSPQRQSPCQSQWPTPEIWGRHHFWGVIAIPVFHQSYGWPRAPAHPLREDPTDRWWWLMRVDIGYSLMVQIVIGLMLFDGISSWVVDDWLRSSNTGGWWCSRTFRPTFNQQSTASRHAAFGLAKSCCRHPTRHFARCPSLDPWEPETTDRDYRNYRHPWGTSWLITYTATTRGGLSRGKDDGRVSEMSTCPPPPLQQQHSVSAIWYVTSFSVLPSKPVCVMHEPYSRRMNTDGTKFATLGFKQSKFAAWFLTVCTVSQEYRV